MRITRLVMATKKSEIISMPKHKMRKARGAEFLSFFLRRVFLAGVALLFFLPVACFCVASDEVFFLRFFFAGEAIAFCLVRMVAGERYSSLSSIGDGFTFAGDFFIEAGTATSQQ